MTRALLLGMLATVLAGCGTDYTRDLKAAEPLGNHHFVRVEFTQAGHLNNYLLHTYWWPPVCDVALVADDGWKLVIQKPGAGGYNWHPDEKHKNDAVHFYPGWGDRLILVDPQGAAHTVKIEVGDVSPKPPHVTDTGPLLRPDPPRQPLPE